MRVFGPLHLAWLCGIAIFSTLLAYSCRREWLPKRPVRLILGCALALYELIRLPSSHLHFPNRLPLELCNVSIWVAIVACFTLAPLAVEYVYFAGLASAVVALLDPDLGTVRPMQFFIPHAEILIVATTLVFGKMAAPRPDGMWRAFAMVEVYAASIGIFDWRFRTNYAYMCVKPPNPTLLSLMGPWPVYILSESVFALVLFWILRHLLRSRAVSPGS